MAEKVSPAEVLHYYKQSFLVSNTSSSFTIFEWFNILLLLNSKNSYWMMEMLFFVFLMALIATTHLVVWADRALGFQVGEQVSPTEVLHYYNQSLLTLSHFQ